MFLSLLLISFYAGLISFKHTVLSLLILFGTTLFLVTKRKYKNLIFTIGIYVTGLLIFLMYKYFVFSAVPGIVTESKNNYFIVRIFTTYYYVPMKESPYEVGDILSVKGVVSDYYFQEYESQFSFNDYLKNKYVYNQIEQASITRLFSSPFKVRTFIYSNLEHYNESSRIILGKLLFNFSLSEEYNSMISKDALFYLLSCSSLHVNFINKFIYKLINIRLKDRHAYLFIIALTIIIYIFSNYKITILKIIIFYSVNYYFEYRSKQKLKYLDKIAISGIIMLLLKPMFSLSDGFIYCYLMPYYFVLIRDGLSTIRKRYQPFAFLALIFLFMLPISVFRNGYFSPLSMVITQLLFPIIIFYYILGLIGIFVPIYPLINFIGGGLYKVIFAIDKVSFNVYIGSVGFEFLIVYYLLLILFIYHLENKNRPKQIKICIISTIIMCLYSLPISNRVSYEVDFINVGQGDSTLIRYHNTSILVDTGGIKNNDLAKDSLIPFLKKKRIRKLDYVFITHSDFDHSGAFESLNRNFIIKDYNKTNDFEQIIIYGIEFINLNPSKSNEENDDSLVLYFKLKNDYYLLMGDASISIERNIMMNYNSIEVDYLKVGHHGSDTSTCEEFIKYTKPKEAIISCGVNNRYKHPHKKVLEILDHQKVKIRRTDKEGTIVVKKYDL